MDKELPTHAEDRQRGLETLHGDHPSPCTRKPGRRQKRWHPPPPAVELLLRTVKHFLSGLSAAMNRLPDPRNPHFSLYTQAHLLWNGILLFMMHLGSRRQMRFERLAECFLQNLANV